MKKLISIFLCAMMLLSAMSLAALAQDFDAGIPAYDAPVIDGVIDEGEYNWTSGVLSTTEGVDGVLYPTTYDVAVATTAEFFVAHDEEFIYVAFREENELTNTNIWLDLNPRAGLDDTQGQILCQIKINEGVVTSSALECTSKSERTNENGKYIYDVVGVAENGVNTFEVQFERAALEDYAGGEFDVLGFRAAYQNFENIGKKEAYFYGDTSSPAMPYWFGAGYGYHLLTFQPAPETEAPTEAPTEAHETEAPETEAPATDAPETEAPATDAPETEAPAEGGCGSSVAAIGVALVATLGTCTAFVTKKR